MIYYNLSSKLVEWNNNNYNNHRVMTKAIDLYIRRRYIMMEIIISKNIFQLKKPIVTYFFFFYGYAQEM